MSNKVTYQEAKNILASFLGCNISVEKPTSLSYFNCRVFRMKKQADGTYDYALIAEGKKWEIVFERIFPNELYQNGCKPDYKGAAFASIIYQYRYIGKTI